MVKAINKTLTLDSLSCTEKALRDIQSFTNELSGRERQLIVLMTRDTAICDMACERLLDKVDLQSLISRGYLNLDDGSDIDYVDTASPVILEEVDPILSLVAGNI